MKRSCERCQAPLGQGAPAFICSYDCTFCETCAHTLVFRCPNCGGELRRR